MRRALTTIALAAAVGMAVAGTGVAAGHRATVKTRHGDHGAYLVDAKGRTLYLFEADKTKKSTCTGDCAKFWPPLLTSGKAKAAGKAKPSLLGTTKRKDGRTQVTYKGHPLYRFSQDMKAGDDKGEGLEAFGAEWYYVAPSGKKVEEEGDDD
jgi:predicted lipoprotein with Yx(FWY)xxD motif